MLATTTSPPTIRSRIGRYGRILALLTAVITMTVFLLPATTATAAVGAQDYTAPGNYQTHAGCAGDWAVDCADTVLTKQPTGLYTLDITVPAGDYEFKIAKGGKWDENWGTEGTPGGDNIKFHSSGAVTTIYFDPETHRAAAVEADNTVVVAGSFQKALGCEGDWQPQCRMPLLFPAADGTYTWTTSRIPAGSYEAKIAIGGSWDTNYGVDGVPGGANYQIQIGQGAPVTFTYHPDTHKLDVISDADVIAGFGEQRALWMDTHTLAWPPDYPEGVDLKNVTVELITSATGDAAVTDGQISGNVERTQLSVGGPLSDDIVANYPHLNGMTTLSLPTDVTREQVDQWLQGQTLVAVTADSKLVAFTGVQTAPVIDCIYAPAAVDTALGVTWDEGVATARLWAPTATDAKLLVITAGGEETFDATRDSDSGVWEVRAPAGADWSGAHYRWQVSVWVPESGEMVTSEVTDPYAKSLTVNSKYAVMVDLSDPTWQPELWTDTPAPAVRNDAARNIYELHIRDFSIADETVPAAERGTYMAFTHAESDGMKHLQALADAGMNTIHLLPSFDIATIPEARSEQKVPDIPADAGPDSPEQQAAVNAVADEDGFNWGYDPFHFQAPEGSYASEGHQEGGERVSQFRSMVGGLHRAGYQVVLDEVYNHTAASGLADKSVLDRIVPGYYHRLSLNGKVETSTCCANLATENTMMEKLMVDSVVTWARDYRVDGFRFDLMGHSSRANMEAVRTALDNLTLDADGVDGKSVYLYGEGWDFGEVAGNARFYQAKQGQLDGTGIGAFNDRLRDAVHGGGPFDEFAREFQGFGNGLFTDPSGFSTVPAPEQQAQLEHSTDLIRLGMAGNLRDFKFLTSKGEVQAGADLDYNGQKAGFASEPQENVNYVDAHDNETLYDLNIMKMPTISTMEDRIRMNTISLATVTWGQSPVFWHAGTDILRSKSLDRDSYNSGDHFNAIDWTLETNGFGNGLPVKGKNGDKWSWMGPLLANPNLKPATADMERANAMARELLTVRTSSPLFALGSADLIRERVTFPGSGPQATPGTLFMHIEDGVSAAQSRAVGGGDIDPQIDAALIAINATPLDTTVKLEELAGREYEVNSIQKDGVDAQVIAQVRWDSSTGTITVPARTAVVLFATTVEEPTPEPTPEPTEEPTVEPTEEPTAEPTPGQSSQSPTTGSQQTGGLSTTGTTAGVVAIMAAIMLIAGTTLIYFRRQR